MYCSQHYVIDWNRVATLEDVKRILKSFGIAYEPDSPEVEAVKDLLRLEDKPQTLLIL